MSILLQKIFDKIVNLKFYRADGGFDQIVIPDTGMKPNISLQGNFITGTVVGQVNLRIVNFYTSVPLDEYKYIVIEAGYQGSLTAVFKGSIWIAYQESPSPDGVTYFQLLTGGEFVDAFLNASMDRTFWSSGTTFNEMLFDCADSIASFTGKSYQLQTSLVESQYQMPHDYNFSGSVKDFLYELQGASTNPVFQYRLDQEALYVWPSNGNTGKIFNIQYLSSPPTGNAAGLTFVSPWYPDLRPGDQVLLDPKYKRQTYGGTQIKLNDILVVQSIEFDFNTVNNVNHMSVLALNTAGVTS